MEHYIIAALLDEITHKILGTDASADPESGLLAADHVVTIDKKRLVEALQEAVDLGRWPIASSKVAEIIANERLSADVSERDDTPTVAVVSVMNVIAAVTDAYNAGRALQSEK
ncbi:hypothetical protein WS58_16725 [Burkholderia pseudomultivorans]|uniref:hypothetical protein n=1 Tax=Burkholderia pseudomultivorans TaxID=1207504 RepID=UPI00075610D9|nr:hypothetical protein [Burkholderia pseudomultivorans]AOI94117.1 hypothetical protein WS57_34955 [Burkholderia pseudomultivorans]KVC27805.1 hypothetical protein WS55_13095 [Burkholderia pseudomultivorans]KVC36927.1 hypothetical protein WS56_00465 [Burkholderia pseudomultivorans]KVC42168.1 hypothetical protein WS58_16725 [Burkholderia pseudomultivorans]